MKVRKAVSSDLPAVMDVIATARDRMHAYGNPNQWVNGYPSVEVITEDISIGVGYVVLNDAYPAGIVGYFAFIPSPEPTYATIYGGAWLDDILPYHVIHRIAGSPDAHGIFAAAIDYAFSVDRNIRIDTHRDNLPMQHCLAKHGFTYCGIIYLDSGAERLAYQRLEL